MNTMDDYKNDGENLNKTLNLGNEKVLYNTMVVNNETLSKPLKVLKRQNNSQKSQREIQTSEIIREEKRKRRSKSIALPQESLHNIIKHLLASDAVLLLYEITSHPIIKYFVVHNIPLDTSNISILQQRENDISKKASILPPVTIYHDTILLYHISYFQHCLKQQDLFVTYVNGYLKAMKENILMRNEMNQLMIQQKLYNVVGNFLKDKNNEARFLQSFQNRRNKQATLEEGNGNGTPDNNFRNVEDNENSQITIDNWIHATVEFALERLDFISGRDNLESIVDSLKSIKLEHDHNSSVKQLVLNHGIQHLLTNYAIDLFWPWKDIDLIVCVRNEKLYSDQFLKCPDASTSNPFPWSQSYLHSINGVRQTRCLVMDHNSKIKAISHDYPISVQLTGKVSSKQKAPTEKIQNANPEVLIQNRILESYILDNIDGYVCTIFYEQGEWLMASGEAFRGRFTNETSNSNPIFSCPTLALDPIISESATVTRVREKHLGPKEMSDLFWGTFYECGYDMPTDMNCCYTFILQSSEYPKHVLPENDKLYLISVHEILNDSHEGRHQLIREKDIFQVSRELKYEVPIRHSFRTVKEILDSLLDLNPLESRGYVLLMPISEVDSKISSNDALRFEKMYERYLLDSPQFLSCNRLKHFHRLKKEDQESLLYDIIRSEFDEVLIKHIKFRTESAKEQAQILHTQLKKRVQKCMKIIQTSYDEIYELPKKNFKENAKEYPFHNALFSMKSLSLTLSQYMKREINSSQFMKLLKTVEDYDYSISAEHFDYLVVIDFEATCDEGLNPTITPENQEIIEFPIVILDLSREQTEEEANASNFEYNIIHKSQYYVKPVQSKGLTSFCTSLTGIHWKDLKNAPNLEEILQKVDSDIKSVIPSDKSFCIICDGQWDIKLMLFREAQRKKIPLPNYYYKFFNIKSEVRKRFPKMMTNSLKVMSKNMGVSLYGHHHSGIDDCISITRVINSLIVKTGHKFTNPIVLDEDYTPQIEPSMKVFGSVYSPGSWDCIKCGSKMQPTQYSCSVCRTKRPTMEHLQVRKAMNQLIEAVFKIPKEFSSKVVENNRIQPKPRYQTMQFLKRLMRSGIIGLVFFFIMKRLEPKRNRMWGVVSLIMILTSYISNWPNTSQIL